MSEDDDVWPPRPKKASSPKATTQPSSENPTTRETISTERGEKSANAPSDTVESLHRGQGDFASPSTPDVQPNEPQVGAEPTIESVWPPPKTSGSRAEESDSPNPDFEGWFAEDTEPATDGLLSSQSASGTNPVQAVASAFRQYAEFRGRASRSEFWWFVAFLFVAGISAALNETLFAVYFLGMLLPSLSITARRLRDSGNSPWWTLILLVPAVGQVVIAIFATFPSRDRENDPGAIGIERDKPTRLNGSARIPARVVDRRPLSPDQASTVFGINVLAFLASQFGIVARYLYLDTRQLWRNPHRQVEFAFISSLLVLLTAGVGFFLTNLRWWGHTGNEYFKKIAWAGLGPIALFTFLGPVFNVLVPSTPVVNSASIPMSFFSLFALAGWSFSIALRTAGDLD